MSYTLQFECVKGLKKCESGCEVPEDYSFWEPVMRRFLPRCDTFVLYCRLADKEAVESGAKIGARDNAELSIEDLNEVWTGKLDDRFVYELLRDPLDSQGRVKWYSLVLKNGKKTVVSAHKYGREFGVHGVAMEDAEAVAAMLPPERFSFCYWEEAGSGEEIEVESLLQREDELSGLVSALGGHQPSMEKQEESGE